MFQSIFDNFRRATETTVQMQQEMFKTWMNLWPGVQNASPAFGEQIQQFQKKWTETVGDLIKRQREATEGHFKTGLQNIEKAFQLGGMKTPEDLRAKSMELWQKCFEDLRQVYEAQLHGFEAILAKWSEFTPKAA